MHAVDAPSPFVQGVTIGVLLGILLGLLGMRFALPDPPCVPRSAIDYRGDLNAWLDADGVVVAMAVEEDTLPWCR